MGGAQPEVLTTLTTDYGKLIDGLHRTKIRGKSHFSTALNVAGLALKHRQNKSQRQRIIMFTCSPLSEDTPSLTKLAKRLKKNNIAVDVISFGDLESTTTASLEAFHENIKTTGDNVDPDDASNLAVIPPGPNLLSDSIVATPILSGVGGGFGAGGGADGDFGGAAGGDGGGGGGGADHEFGVDPNADPELALALRMSMQEEEQKQARLREEEEKKQREENGGLEAVPEEKAEGSGEGGAGAEKKKDGEDKKDDGAAGGDKMDTS